MSESLALARVRTRRRPRKPPGFPPPWPWWVSALLALLSLGAVAVNLATDMAGWAAWNGAMFCVNGSFAYRDWQWDRYNRWKGGR